MKPVCEVCGHASTPDDAVREEDDGVVICSEPAKCCERLTEQLEHADYLPTLSPTGDDHV